MVHWKGICPTSRVVCSIIEASGRLRPGLPGGFAQFLGDDFGK
ncbi:hypothetical protein [Arthrobacter sp. UYEF20]